MSIYIYCAYSKMYNSEANAMQIIASFRRVMRVPPYVLARLRMYIVKWHWPFNNKGQGHFCFSITDDLWQAYSEYQVIWYCVDICLLTLAFKIFEKKKKIATAILSTYLSRQTFWYKTTLIYADGKTGVVVSEFVTKNVNNVFVDVYNIAIWKANTRK